MLVAASTTCFAALPLKEALSRFVDLEYTNVELTLSETGPQLKPSEVLADLDAAVATCRDVHRLNLVAFDVRQQASGTEYYAQFDAICRLAKAVKVVTITVPSSEFGTPFNEEVERLRHLVDIATLQGVRVGLRTQTGCLSEDPDTVVVLCDNVKGLGVTLDPSHFITGNARRRDTEKLMKYVYHVLLRDSSKDALQVRVGQGEIEYGKLTGQLSKVGYNRALSVDIVEMPGVDHFGELRKMRLLLESLL